MALKIEVIRYFGDVSKGPRRNKWVLLIIISGQIKDGGLSGRFIIFTAGFGIVCAGEMVTE